MTGASFVGVTVGVPVSCGCRIVSLPVSFVSGTSTAGFGFSVTTGISALSVVVASVVSVEVVGCSVVADVSVVTGNSSAGFNSDGLSSVVCGTSVEGASVVVTGFSSLVTTSLGASVCGVSVVTGISAVGVSDGGVSSDVGRLALVLLSAFATALAVKIALASKPRASVFWTA